MPARNFLLTVIHPGMVIDKGSGFIAKLRKGSKRTMVRLPLSGQQIPTFHSSMQMISPSFMSVPMDKKADGLLLNASAIKSATAEEVGKLVAQACGDPYQARVISIEEAQERYGPWASAYARSKRMSSDRATQLLGWKPHYATIEKMVEDSLKDDC